MATLILPLRWWNVKPYFTHSLSIFHGIKNKCTFCFRLNTNLHGHYIGPKFKQSCEYSSIDICIAVSFPIDIVTGEIC